MPERSKAQRSYLSESSEALIREILYKLRRATADRIVADSNGRVDRQHCIIGLRRLEADGEVFRKMGIYELTGRGHDVETLRRAFAGKT